MNGLIGIECGLQAFCIGVSIIFDKMAYIQIISPVEAANTVYLQPFLWLKVKLFFLIDYSIKD